MLSVISGSASLQTSRDSTLKHTQSILESKLSRNNVKATLHGNLRISIRILSLHWITFFLYVWNLKLDGRFPPQINIIIKL